VASVLRFVRRVLLGKTLGVLPVSNDRVSGGVEIPFMRRPTSTGDEAEGSGAASSLAAPIVQSLSPSLPSSFEAGLAASCFTSPFAVATAKGMVFPISFDRAPSISGSDASDADDVETNDKPVKLRSNGGRADSSASETLAEE
jgi:hypothetical protein